MTKEIPQSKELMVRRMAAGLPTVREFRAEAPAKRGLLSRLGWKYPRPSQEELAKCWADAKEAFLKDLEEKGLLKEIPIIAQPNVHRGAWGSVDGEFSHHSSFFLFFGSSDAGGRITGDLRTVSSVQFAWQPETDGDIAISEVPIDKARFRIDESCEQPTVLFTPNKGEFVKIGTLASPTGFKSLYDDIATVQVLTYPKPEDYIKDRRLQETRFTIPSAEFLNGLPLQSQAKELQT